MSDDRKQSNISILRYGANALHANNAECEQHGGNCCQSGWCCEKPNRTN